MEQRCQGFNNINNVEIDITLQKCFVVWFCKVNLLMHLTEAGKMMCLPRHEAHIITDNLLY